VRELVEQQTLHAYYYSLICSHRSTARVRMRCGFPAFMERCGRDQIAKRSALAGGISIASGRKFPRNSAVEIAPDRG
jgi:hypothetical protein